MSAWHGVIEQYRKFLPVSEKTRIVSLNEGNTPLVRAHNLEALIGGGFEIWLKCEGLNPTASFKDRGMTVAVSKAIERGAKAIICASTGNTSSSAAAYAARANIKCIVILPEGAIAKGKLAQAMMYGANVIAVKGNFDDALRIVREIGEETDIQIVNSINPDRIEGQKTASFEICDALERAPDYHVLPVGNAGNITAYWKGYREYRDAGVTKTAPKMIGFQAEGAAPIVRGHPVEKPETVASAIRIG
ncbi:MAG TPA: threonine synthase, partial [Verrucomicrobiae bacterium]|nr:threonine synthase [Verrucomicrobiae bacterium]